MFWHTQKRLLEFQKERLFEQMFSLSIWQAGGWGQPQAICSTNSAELGSD